MVEATSAVSRERRKMGEAAVARGGNTSPSSMFLALCGPNACHNDQAGTKTHAINSCAGISISAGTASISTYKRWFSGCNSQLPLDP